MMRLGEALGLGFVWESDGVGFEGGVTAARWWCNGWSVKGSTVAPIATKAKQTTEIEGRNEQRKKKVGLGFGVLNEMTFLPSFK